MLPPQRQRHSIRYESYFLVFKKDQITKTQYFSGFSDNLINTILNNFRNHNQTHHKSLRGIDPVNIKAIKKRQDGKDLTVIKDTIKKLHKKGLSNRQIAEVLQISEFKVRYWLKKRKKRN